jgi:hypothetical protein
VSGFERVSTALFAAGVSTAADGELVLGLVPPPPRLFPVVPWLRALEVLGPGEPPVPLMVVPFDRAVPAAPPAPVELVPPELAPVLPPPELLPLDPCANATGPVKANAAARTIVLVLIYVFLIGAQTTCPY